MKLAGRVAVITGGARGIGFATAARLVRQGCSVGLWDLDAGALREAAGASRARVGSTRRSAT